jgi:hypothetical protein
MSLCPQISTSIPARKSKTLAVPGWIHEIKHDGYRLGVEPEQCEGRRNVAGIRWSHPTRVTTLITFGKPQVRR